MRSFAVLIVRLLAGVLLAAAGRRLRRSNARAAQGPGTRRRRWMLGQLGVGPAPETVGLDAVTVPVARRPA